MDETERGSPCSSAKPRQPNGAVGAGYVPLPYVDMSTWDDGPPPRREWLIADCIPHRAVSLLSGEGGVGKSVLALQLAVAVVLGRGWLSYLPELSGGVLYLSCEDDELEIRRRLKPMLDQHKAIYVELIDRGFHLLCFCGQDAVLAGPNSNGSLGPTALFESIRTDARRLRPRAIFIDTVADTFGGSEIDRVQVRRFMGLLRALAIECNATVILLAHPSLSGITNRSGLSGSTGWHNSSRARIYLTSVKAKDGTVPDPNLRELQFLKSNYGPLGEPVQLRWSNGVFGLADMGTGYIEKLAAEQRTDELFIKLLERFNNQGQRVTAKVGTSYAPAKFADHPEACGVSNKAFAKAMQRLLDMDKIRIEEDGPPSHRRSKLVLA
jgi:RecA-family ATPase